MPHRYQSHEKQMVYTFGKKQSFTYPGPVLPMLGFLIIWLAHIFLISTIYNVILTETPISIAHIVIPKVN